ncbi:MAG: segregation/condensation protein A [Candidatus Micrarchaeia archaeon]
MQVAEREVVLQGSLDLEQFVREATWKDLLFELVRRNAIDPWDINISKLVEEYLAAIRAIRLLDLKVPANMMLAAAILVRLKSDMLNLEDEEQPQAEEEQPQQQLLADVLTPRVRLPPKRKITLAELISALDEAIKTKESREQKFAEMQRPVPFAVSIADVEAEANAVYETLKKHADSTGMLTFSELCAISPEKNLLLELFLPLLFLAQSGKVDLFQERFFGELLIKVIEAG